MLLLGLVASEYEDMLNHFKSWKLRDMIIEDGEMSPMFISIFSFSP